MVARLFYPFLRCRRLLWKTHGDVELPSAALEFGDCHCCKGSQMEESDVLNAAPQRALPATRHRHLQHHPAGMHPCQSLETGCTDAEFSEESARTSIRCGELHVSSGFSERFRCMDPSLDSVA
eukprot:s2707_g5.t1